MLLPISSSPPRGVTFTNPFDAAVGKSPLATVACGRLSLGRRFPFERFDRCGGRRRFPPRSFPDDRDDDWPDDVRRLVGYPPRS